MKKPGMRKFPLTQSGGSKDCGPSCLKMMAAYHGRFYSLDYLRNKCGVTKMGTSMLHISEAAAEIGYRPTGMRLSTDQLTGIVKEMPVILHWDTNHFVVLYKIASGKFFIADPMLGYVTYGQKELEQKWLPGGISEGHALLLEPTPDFSQPITEGQEKKLEWKRLLTYFKAYRFYFLQIIAGMLIGSVLNIIAPVLTQSLVDKGINQHDLDFVYLILFAQLVVFIGTTLIETIRTWLILHIGTRINISMVSDFFLKMLNLPLSFFDTHHTGDLMQRIDNHKRLESLVTVSTLSTLFSVFNMFLLGGILYYYNATIFFIYMAGSLAGLGWILMFLKKRRTVDAQFFDAYSRQSNKIIEILTGVQDIKISNSATQKRWEWETLQAKIFDVKIRSLSYSQFQGIGSSFINRLTSIFITVISAQAVINGSITLGGMFAISMLVGQLTSPVQQLLGFITTLQDAKIGWERISRVWEQEDEDPPYANTIKDIPACAHIAFEKISFSYSGRASDSVLKNISMIIPAGKVTAIVGPSGSGKTTLMKMLLKFYAPDEGNMFLGSYNFRNLHHQQWREKCGVVMQDGQLFSGTISENIALGRPLNHDEVVRAATIANIHDFISTLPLGYLTEIGMQGIQLSTGQKQRIFLARAVYKDPAYLFLDEATNALDATNEKTVMENLEAFFPGRTVVVIAHRLSTVKHADQLIVIDKGEIVETGHHHELTGKKGFYYGLVKNQLELGN